MSHPAADTPGAAIMNSDPDLPVLQSLLDAFPSASLELIASAFTEADGSPDLAAEMISLNLHGFPTSSTHDLLPSKRRGNEKTAAAKVAPTRNKQLLPLGSRQHCLQDYFPLPPENAWSRPPNVSEGSSTNVERSTHTSEETDISVDFPSLGSLNPKLSSSRIPRSRFCCSKSVSATTGLVTNVRRGDPELYSRSFALKETMGVESKGKSTCPTDKEGHSLGDVKKLSTNTHVDDCNLAMKSEHDAFISFEDEVLKREDSSMKLILRHEPNPGHMKRWLWRWWVTEKLLDKFPSVNTEILLEILKANNFNYNDAEKILREFFDEEECFLNSEESIKPYELSNRILETLFSCHEEVATEEKNNKTRNGDNGCNNTSAKEVPTWSVITSSELDCEEHHQFLTCNMPTGGNGMAISQVRSYGDWDDYDRHFSSSKQHWKTMGYYFQAAESAYKQGDFARAEELIEKGNNYKKLAMEAKERATMRVLNPTCQQSDNNFILDLRGQDVRGALKLLKLHLKSLSRIPSCHAFTVIAGSDKDTSSQYSKLTDKVLKYVEERGYDWFKTAPFHYEIKLKMAIEELERSNTIVNTVARI